MLQAKVSSNYVFEEIYGVDPAECTDLDILCVGAGVGLAAMPYLCELAQRELRRQPRIAVVEAGRFDLACHMAHTGMPRRPVLDRGTGRVGGKLTNWGMSAPRPPEYCLRQWPYSYADLMHRFKALEDEMGVSDPVPLSGLHLEQTVRERLEARFPDMTVRPAPLAINRDGHRWCPLTFVPDLVRQGVRLLSGFHCDRILTTKGGSVSGVQGTWHDGSAWTLRARTVILAVGADVLLPLLRAEDHWDLKVEPSDHIRIDAHGSLPSGHFGDQAAERLGIAVLLVEGRSRGVGAPFHLEVKLAPRELWTRGYMTSHDNLRGGVGDELWVQVQAVAAMHDRFPQVDLLNVTQSISPVMSRRDADFHGELVTLMRQTAEAIGIPEPTFAFRPLLTNHHTYGLLRVGKTVSSDFKLDGFDNLYIFPPAAYVDHDDDANPVLKSRVLAQYAVEAIVAGFQSTASSIAPDGRASTRSARRRYARIPGRHARQADLQRHPTFSR
jgi:hypothetical protein